MCLRLAICSEGLMYIICYDFTSESHLFAFVILFALLNYVLKRVVWSQYKPAIATLFFELLQEKAENNILQFYWYNIIETAMISVQTNFIRCLGWHQEF